MNRPRQYGKTTTIYLLEQRLKEDYLIISVSNRVYEQRIYNYFASKIDNNLEKMSKYNFKESFVNENNSLAIG